MKAKIQYQCKVCEFESAKWQGKCPNCGSWNSFQEVVSQTKDEKDRSGAFSVNQSASLHLESLAEVLEQIKTQKQRRVYEFSTPVLNKFWNQGLVAGSLTLLAGEPGLGKSTLGLQLLRSLYLGQPANIDKLKLLYITAEESVFELARRSERLKIPKEILVLQANHFEQIEQVLNTQRPEIVIIDSIQTIFSSQIQSNPGSISQVTSLASQLLAMSKSQNISIILVGHVTKEGEIAGPKTLEHLVDSVLFLEASESPQYRTLSFSKHRFGSTSSLLLLKMEETGLEIVSDPSLALLENLESGTGVVYGLGLDKDLPLVTEIQALVSKPNFAGNFFGRRETLGLKTAKLNTLLAIAEKYLDLDLKNRDIYIQLTGLPKSVQDDSLDLPILLALISSLTERPIATLVQEGDKRSKFSFAGRLTLSGNLRASTQTELREAAAEKLGFMYNSKIKIGPIGDFLGKFLTKT